MDDLQENFEQVLNDVMLIGEPVRITRDAVYEVFYWEDAVGGDPFAVLLADDFLSEYKYIVTVDLAQAFASGCKT